MLKVSWKEQLDQKLTQAAARKRKFKQILPAPLRVALVGVGNELNGDDAAGNQVATQLMGLSGLPAHFLPINAGSIPENATSVLRRFRPDLVIFVDAADFTGKPGEIHWLVEEQIGGMSASSHTLPLSVLGGYLVSELDCQVEYLGIQPAQLDFDRGLTSEVKQSVETLVAELKTFFGDH